MVIFGSFFFFFFFFFKMLMENVRALNLNSLTLCILTQIRPSVVIQHTTHKLLAHCHDMGWLQDVTVDMMQREWSSCMRV